MNRFFDIDLTKVSQPDAITALSYDDGLAARLADLKTRLEAAGITWDFGAPNTDPLVITEQHAAYYDLLAIARTNDAVRATMLAWATGADLENIGARFGVQRKLLVAANPSASPPVAAVFETDDSLRRRIQLAIEAFSTAGPEGAYVFFGLAAHPHVMDIAVYDPQSELCDPGEVLLVVASSQGDGVPTDLVLDSIAEALDARTINYASTAPRTRALTRRQKVRPLTDKVIVEACSTLDYTITVSLKIAYGPDPVVIAAKACERLDAYLSSRRQVARMISDTAIAAAVHVADDSGVAVVDDANITIRIGTTAVGDVVPGPKQLARCTAITLTYEVVT